MDNHFPVCSRPACLNSFGEWHPATVCFQCVTRYDDNPWIYIGWPWYSLRCTVLASYEIQEKNKFHSPGKTEIHLHC